MRVWYFSEMAYHPAWEEGLKRGSLRVVLPNGNLRPARSATSCSTAISTSSGCVTRSGSTSWSTSITARLDLPDDLGADGAGDHRARNQDGAPVVARHADRQPPRSGARRRGNGLARRLVGRPAGDGPRQGRAL